MGNAVRFEMSAQMKVSATTDRSMLQKLERGTNDCAMHNRIRILPEMDDLQPRLR